MKGGAIGHLGRTFQIQRTQVQNSEARMRLVDSWKSKEVNGAGTEWAEGKGRAEVINPHSPVATLQSPAYNTPERQAEGRCGGSSREGNVRKQVGSLIIHRVLQIVTECLL